MGAVPEESEEPTGAQLVNNEREQQSIFSQQSSRGLEGTWIVWVESLGCTTIRKSFHKMLSGRHSDWWNIWSIGLHVPFEGALNITRPRSLKRWVFPSFGSDVLYDRKRPLFFHSNSPPCCFCLDLLHRPLDENKPRCFFFRNPRKDRIDYVFFFQSDFFCDITVRVE